MGTENKIDEIRKLIESTLITNSDLILMLHMNLKYQMNLLDYIFDRLEIEKPKPDEYDFGASLKNIQPGQ